MATESITVLRRFAGFIFTMLFLGVCICAEAAGQSATVLTNTTTAPFNATTQNGVSLSAVWNIAVSQQGDIILEDFSAGSLFQVPADGRPVITITNGGTGGWGDLGVAVDLDNNIIIGCPNWCTGLFKVPYDSVNKTWNFSKGAVWAPSSGWYHSDAISENSSGLYAIGSEYGSWIVTMPASSAANGANGNFTQVTGNLKSRVTSISIDNAGNIAWIEGAGGNPPGSSVYWISAATAALGTATEATALDISTTNSNSAVSAPKGTTVNGLAVDAAGNVYIADANIGVYVVPLKNGVPNPAGSYVLASVPGTNGLAIDQIHGTLIVPTTQTTTAKSMWENAGYYAVIKYGAGDVGSLSVGASQPNTYTMQTWGDYPAGSTGVWYTFYGTNTVTPAQFVFQEDGLVTSQDFELVTLTPPSGGTFKTPQCAVATQYGPGNNSCFVQVALAPLAAGTASTQLLMQTEQAVSSGSASYSATITGYSYSAATGILTLTATNGFLPYELVKFSVSPPSGVSSPLAALANSSFSVLGNGLSANQFEIVTNAITGSGTQSSSNQFYTTATGVYTYTTVASTTLHGTGLGANVAVTPSLETTIGSGLKNPGEMAMDAAGNLYVADAGLGKVIEFAAGSSIPTAVGSGFTAPTGVAVNGDGDVFVADSGNVYEVPLWSAAAPTKLLSGLGTKLSLAVDGTNTLYIADPDNARVIRLWNLGVSGTGLLAQSEVLLTSGFTAPSLVAVDSSNNLYVVDGANLIEVSPSGTSTLLSNLSKVTGLAVDASGAVYLTATGGTSRIPSVSGALNASAATAIASTVTKPGGVALDRLGNVYLSDATALNVHEVETTGTLNFGTLPTPTSNKTLPATLTNAGNAALTVTGYSASKAPGGSTSYFPAETDYYPTDVNCETSSVAVGGNCTMDIEFNPGPGDQGTLTSVVSIADNATNGTVGIDNTGVGAPLASSVVSFTVGSSSEVVNTTVNVTVKASSGSAVPTGEVTVYYQSPTTTLDATHNPTNQTLTQTLVLSNGAATITLAPVAAGSPSFTVSYQGDRVFGKATLTATGTVAKSNVKGMTLPAANTIPFYVQETTDSSTPYDGSQDPWTYALAATVTAKAGTPTGILEFLDSGSVACPATSGAGTPYLNTAGSADLDVGCLPMATGLTYVPYTSSHTITLAYQGDLNYNSYTYPGSFTMIAVRSSGVLVTAVGGTATTVSSSDGSVSASSALTVKAGSSASATLTLTSILGYGIQGNNQQLNNYTFPLSLSCDNLPPHSICTFSYPTPDPNIASAFDILNCNKTGSAPALPNPYQITGRNCSTGTVVVTINTNVAVGTTTSQNSPAMPLKSGALLLAGLLGLFFSRKLRQGWRTLTMGFACLLFLGSALLATTACATANLSPAAILSTPAGTYNVIITAQQVGTLTVTGSGAATVITGSQNQDSITFTLPVTVQ